jgi:hypothetical protein
VLFRSVKIRGKRKPTERDYNEIHDENWVIEHGASRERIKTIEPSFGAKTCRKCDVVDWARHKVQKCPRSKRFYWLTRKNSEIKGNRNWYFTKWI